MRGYANDRAYVEDLSAGSIHYANVGDKKINLSGAV